MTRTDGALVHLLSTSAGKMGTTVKPAWHSKSGPDFASKTSGIRGRNTIDWTALSVQRKSYANSFRSYTPILRTVSLSYPPWHPQSLYSSGKCANKYLFLPFKMRVVAERIPQQSTDLQIYRKPKTRKSLAFFQIRWEAQDVAGRPVELCYTVYSCHANTALHTPSTVTSHLDKITVKR